MTRYVHTYLYAMFNIHVTHSLLADMKLFNGNLVSEWAKFAYFVQTFDHDHNAECTEFS